MKKLSVLFMAICTLLLASCSATPDDPVKTLQSISLNKSRVEIEIGDTYQLRVWFEPEEAEDTAGEVVWESSKPSIASVDEKGLVTAKSVGSATITATCGKFEATCKVEVIPEPDPIPVESIGLDETTLSMFAGDEHLFQVTYYPEESERHAAEIVWASSDESVVSVSQEGLATAISEGTATITAACGTHEATCQITVLPMGLSISPKEINSSKKGGTFNIVVNSNLQWTATYNADWLSVSPSSGAASDNVTITVNPSTSETKQSATVIFSNLIEKDTLYVSCEGYASLFSVAADKQVIFSPGNLQYQPSTHAWRFAEKQYDMIGDDNAKRFDSGFKGWIDLFAWSAGQDPTYVDIAVWPDDAHSSFYEFGNNIEPTQNWRTPTTDEWRYLFSSRSNADQLYGFANIDGINGFVFLPDGFVIPNNIKFTTDNIPCTFGSFPILESSTLNQYTPEEWLILQDEGAVFLPCSGYLYNKTLMRSYNVSGTYISSTYRGLDNQKGYDFHISVTTSSCQAIIYYVGITSGHAVRLIKDFQ